MSEIDLTHESGGIVVRYSLPPEVETAAGKLWNEHLERHFAIAAVALPDMVELRRLRAMGKGIQAEVSRLEKDLERQDPFAAGEGKDAASKIGAAAQKQQALTERLESARVGARLFAQQLADVEKRARTAIRELFAQAAKRIHSEVSAQRGEVSFASVAAAIDTLAVLRRVEEFSGWETGAAAQVEAVLQGESK